MPLLECMDSYNYKFITVGIKAFGPSKGKALRLMPMEKPAAVVSARFFFFFFFAFVLPYIKTLHNIIEMKHTSENLVPLKCAEDFSLGFLPQQLLKAINKLA